MASGSGKDRDDGKQEPARVHGQRDDASAASPAGAPSFGAAQAGSRAGLPKAKKTILRKIISSGKDKLEVLKTKAIPYGQALNHYVGQILALYRDRIYAVNAIGLGDRYSEFRPVEEDGECFYRSFIFSYLEQVLDRKGRNEERRLLAAIQELAEESACLGWASEFSRSHDVQAETSRVLQHLRSNRRQADYTEDIPGLGENDCVANWCLQHVTPRRVVAGRVQMWALAAALQVSLVLVQLNEEAPDDVYVSPGADAARVHVLFTVNHYDIIYPI
uniref:Uncharacterized protein n=1 Tax=Aegilops tauschii TaxID=37682 RepID=M8CFY6_AEGTA